MNSWESEFSAALESRNESNAIEILKCGFPVNFQIKLKDQNGRFMGGFTFPLIQAVENGLSEVVRHLLVYGAFINCVDSFARTPLLVAAALGHSDIMQILVQNKAQIGCRDFYGNTILHIAASNMHLAIVKYCLKQLKIPLEVTNKKKQTPFTLCKAIQDESKNIEDIQELQKVVEYLWKQKQRLRNSKHKFEFPGRIEQTKCRKLTKGTSPAVPLKPVNSYVEKLVSPIKAPRSIQRYLDEKHRSVKKLYSVNYIRNRTPELNLSKYVSPRVSYANSFSATPIRLPPISRFSHI